MLKNVLQELDKASELLNETNGLAEDTSKVQNETSTEVLTIPLGTEDDLSDIPTEMREVVAAEIAAFRERSLRRDAQKLQRQGLKGQVHESNCLYTPKPENDSARTILEASSPIGSNANHSRFSRKGQSRKVP